MLFRVYSIKKERNGKLIASSLLFLFRISFIHFLLSISGKIKEYAIGLIAYSLYYILLSQKYKFSVLSAREKVLYALKLSKSSALKFWIYAE